MVSEAEAWGQRRRPLVILIGVAVSTLCLTACSDGTTDTQEPGATNPTVVVSPPQTSATVAPIVQVQASIGVQRSPAVDAVVAFVQGHAESVDAGRVTPGLIAATTSAELARQRQVVAFAVSHGYAVPLSPVVRVVTVLDESTTVATLGVCFWLPSTEYVDAATGDSPNGPVPKAWAPAVATVRLVDVTWSVDTVSEPDNETTIGCGDNP